MSAQEPSGTGPAGSTRRWYRSELTPLWVGLVLVSVVALVAGFGWSGSRASQCSARDVAHTTMASVVTIFVRAATGAQSNGSGEFIDRGGHILTNNHVINSSLGGGTITVLRPNGEELPARLVGRDNDTDLAVIDVEPKSDVVPVAFGPAPRVGDQVFAIGAPMGLSDTLTAGVVGALGRSVRVPADPGTTALITSAIQTDASINPGNSGGTLANCRGQLVGVPTAGSTANDSLGQPVGGSIGLGFAIPADFAQRIAELLVADGRVSHGDAGMSVIPVARGSDATKPDGLYVAEVVPGGAAAQAGLRHADIITELDGRRVTSADQLQAITLTEGPGAKLALTYERDGESRNATLTLQG